MRRIRLGNIRVTFIARGPPSATAAPYCSSRTGSTDTAARPPHGVSCGLSSRLLMRGHRRPKNDSVSKPYRPRERRVKRRVGEQLYVNDPGDGVMPKAALPALMAC